VQRASRGDRYDEITDKWIPEKPVSKAEAGGYTVIIAAGLAVALGAVWYSLKELVLESSEQTVFALAVGKAEVDPRVLVRVGTPMTAYGKEGRSRSARSRLGTCVRLSQIQARHTVCPYKTDAFFYVKSQVHRKRRARAVWDIRGDRGFRVAFFETRVANGSGRD
jgi:hypothetical protein